jgi:hypothetical protein
LSVKVGPVIERAGKMTPLRDARVPPVITRQWTSSSVVLINFQLQIAVAQEQGIAGLDVFGEVMVGDGDLVAGTGDLARGQGERRAGFQGDRPRSHLTDPDLQPGEILKDGNGPT